MPPKTNQVIPEYGRVKKVTENGKVKKVSFME